MGEDEAKARKGTDLQSNTNQFNLKKENAALASNRTEAWERVDQAIHESPDAEGGRAKMEGVDDLFRCTRGSRVTLTQQPPTGGEEAGRFTSILRRRARL